MPFRTLTLLLLALSALTPLAAQDRLVIKGSDTLGEKLLPLVLSAWHQTNPKVPYEWTAEGSGTGIDALIHGRANLALSSRRARYHEFALARGKGVVLNPTLICQDGIVVVVHERSPLENLSLRELGRIFTGELRNWAGVGGPEAGIRLYIRNPASGTHFDFQAMAMARREYAASAHQLPGNEQIVAAVAHDPRGIGYVGMAFADAPGIKVLRVEGIAPTVATVLDHRYPMARPNFVYTDGESSGAVRDFIDFLISAEGQYLVQVAGFAPWLPSVAREEEDELRDPEDFEEDQDD